MELDFGYLSQTLSNHSCPIFYGLAPVQASQSPLPLSLACASKHNTPFYLSKLYFFPWQVQGLVLSPDKLHSLFLSWFLLSVCSIKIRIHPPESRKLIIYYYFIVTKTKGKCHSGVNKLIEEAWKTCKRRRKIPQSKNWKRIFASNSFVFSVISILRGKISDLRGLRKNYTQYAEKIRATQTFTASRTVSEVLGRKL